MSEAERKGGDDEGSYRMVVVRSSSCSSPIAPCFYFYLSLERIREGARRKEKVSHAGRRREAQCEVKRKGNEKRCPTPGDRRREAAVRPRGEKEKVSVPRFLTFLVAKRGEAEAQTKRKGKLPTWRKEEKRIARR